MRQLFTGFILVFHGSITPGLGQNLVPNPSFEDTVACPSLPGHPISSAVSWRTCNGSVDYWSTCNGSIPNNPTLWGGIAYQQPSTGNAFAGLICHSASGAKEIIGATLISPLTIGQEYYFSFKISLGSCFESSNSHIGIKFSNGFYSGFSNPTLINNNAHFYYPGIISDTLNWSTISGSFIADSAYQQIMIGNFFTTGYLVDPPTCGSADQNYYFIDDICLSSDSSYCQNWTNFPEISPIYISIHPNPANDFIKIEGHKIQGSISLFDFSGKIIKSLMHSSEFIYVGDLASGIYLLRLESAQSNKVVKFVKY